MTGFGRGEATVNGITAVIEASSVNRKQLEVTSNFARDSYHFEKQAKNQITQQFTRGRIQLNLTTSTDQSAISSTLSVNQQEAQKLEQAFQKLSQFIGREVLPTAADYLRFGGIIGESENKETLSQQVEPAFLSALAEALNDLLLARKSEGQALEKDLRNRIKTLESMTIRASELAENRIEKHSNTLLKRIADLGLELNSDDDRIAKEVALFADRCDITEEITRLETHLSRFREYLDAGKVIGRQLDFLCQELSRELNTIASKANNAPLSQLVVEAKSELEKIREQVQNIE